MTDVLMPALSPTMEEGTLAKWHVKVGDEVRSGDVIAEIETDKATMEVEAVDEGVVEALLVPEGTEEVKVNTPIARLKGEGEASTPSPPPQAATPPAPANGAKKPDVSAPPPQAAKASPATAAYDGAASRSERGDDRVLASPLARRIAEQAGIDLSQVKGSGPHGRIIRRDLEGLKGAPAAQPVAQPPQGSCRRAEAQRRGGGRAAARAVAGAAGHRARGPTTSFRSTG